MIDELALMKRVLAIAASVRELEASIFCPACRATRDAEGRGKSLRLLCPACAPQHQLFDRLLRDCCIVYGAGQ